MHSYQSKIPVVDTHNEFTASREPPVPDENERQVPMKHDFREIFERKKFDGLILAKVS